MIPAGELEARVNALSWVHRIDLGHGIVTPGTWTTPKLILEAFANMDFAGAKVLDIGCWDGLWSFEAEKRGAHEVYATDLLSQRHGTSETLLLAREALGSHIRYYPSLSVYDIDSLGVCDFDIVLFSGVYYHLKHPLKALAGIRKTMASGGTLLIEGEVLRGPRTSYARFFYHDSFHSDFSNWWVPTLPCLRDWVQSSYFEIQREYSESLLAGGLRVTARRCIEALRYGGVPARHLILASAVERRDPGYLYRDEELGIFDHAT
jgi:tRNA (mo5U34)-methyltransferase